MRKAKKEGMNFLVLTLSASFLALVLISCAPGYTKLTKTETKSLIPSGELKDGVRVIKVQAKQYEFVPDPIVVMSGEQVQLEVTSLDVTHGFGISELKIDRQLSPGKTETITFKAEAEGSYLIHCSVFCGMGHFGMKGNLVVLPAEK